MRIWWPADRARESMNRMSYKIGDRVMILTHNFHPKNGRCGTVVGRNQDRYSLYYLVSVDGSAWRISPGQLRKLTTLEQLAEVADV